MHYYYHYYQYIKRVFRTHHFLIETSKRPFQHIFRKRKQLSTFLDVKVKRLRINDHNFETIAISRKILRKGPFLE